VDGAESTAMVSSLYTNFDFLKEIFDKWDADKSGQVDRGEFKAAITLMQEVAGAEQMDSDTLFDLIDLNGTGKIDLNELCEASRLSRSL